MHDLAIIIVSTNEAHWLRPCLTTVFAQAGAIELDVVVADNESTDGTRELVESEFPAARVVTCENKGFAHANNRGLITCDARYVLFLNPDTEIRQGTFEELVRALDARRDVGLAGVRQITADGQLYPTIRRFPNALRALGDALAAERFPFRTRWLGERELNLEVYDREVACDWTSGSFMIARREALESAGYMDERFFIYSEEPDLCYRMRQAGWEIRHLPVMTILHHAAKAGIKPKMVAQDLFTRRQYASKHFSPAHRAAYLSALGLSCLLRLLPIGSSPDARRQRRGAAWRALLTLLGGERPPFGEPPGQAVALRESRDDQAGEPTPSSAHSEPATGEVR
jgi:N-acetylglucosaminyl-diphospho-decaprenol L-rhamnosyltransferase